MRRGRGVCLKNRGLLPLGFFRRSQHEILCLVVLLVLTAVTAAAQACPKVTDINPTATIQSLVISVNCLIDTTERARSGPAETGKAAFAVPAGSTTKTALVTPENRAASVSGTAGVDCKIKINSDSTVDGQCKQTGGVLYVIYRD